MAYVVFFFFFLVPIYFLWPQNSLGQRQNFLPAPFDRGSPAELTATALFRAVVVQSPVYNVTTIHFLFFLPSAM